MAEQIPFGPEAHEFVNNPEPRVPCVLLLDTSGSMSGKPITELNAGLVAYRDAVMADSTARKRVEVAIVTFGPVNLAVDFTTAENFTPPTLVADGNTPMGEAIIRGIDMVNARKQVYRQNGVDYYRPWVFLITDGAPDPTDDWRQAARLVREAEQANNLAFFAVGVENADMEVLKQIAVRPPQRLAGLGFRDLFLWLSKSQKAVSQSRVGESVPLPQVDWTSV